MPGTQYDGPIIHDVDNILDDETLLTPTFPDTVPDDDQTLDEEVLDDDDQPDGTSRADKIKDLEEQLKKLKKTDRNQAKKKKVTCTKCNTHNIYTHFYTTLSA